MNKRQSNIELLRIIAMFLIVAHHYIAFVSYDFSIENYSFNMEWMRILQYGGKMGSNIFVLISGYLTTNKKVTYKKPLLLFIDVTVLSMIILLVFMLFGYKFELSKDISNLLPIIYNSYWFMTTYFILSCLMPIINKLLNSINHKQHLFLMLIMIVIISLLPTLRIIKYTFSHITQFVMLYVIGAYIKQYKETIKIKNPIMIAIAIYVGCLMFCFVMDYVGYSKGNPLFISYADYFMWESKITAVIIPALLLIGFVDLNINNNLINKIGKYTLYVYLIHCHPLVLYKLIDIFSKMPIKMMINPFVSLFTILVICLCSFVFGVMYDEIVFKRLKRLLDN